MELRAMDACVPSLEPQNPAYPSNASSVKMISSTSSSRRIFLIPTPVFHSFPFHWGPCTRIPFSSQTNPLSTRPLQTSDLTQPADLVRRPRPRTTPEAKPHNRPAPTARPPRWRPGPAALWRSADRVLGLGRLKSRSHGRMAMGFVFVSP